MPQRLRKAVRPVRDHQENQCIAVVSGGVQSQANSASKGGRVGHHQGHIDYDKVYQDVYFIGQEIKAAEMAHHRNLVEVYCSFTSERKLWVVMPVEMVKSVKEVLVHGLGSAAPCLPLRMAAFVLKELLNGLCFLHEERKMLHRHVDVDHIFLDVNFDVKLVDNADVNGYDFASDVWGFGVTALHLVHGCVPIEKAEDLEALLENLIVQKQESEKRRRKSYSRIIFKGLTGLLSCYAPGGVSCDDEVGYEALVDMVRLCLHPDGSGRPTAKQLMEHSFLKQVDDEAEMAFKNMLKTNKSLISSN
ncbi:hypothetical protein QQ045_021376 [Rhodiola kirilowii]